MKKTTTFRKGLSMNPNPVGGLFLMAFVGLMVWAVFAAEGKWKLFNLLISLGGAAIGVGLDALGGAFASNGELGGHLAASLLPIFGGAAAYICVRRSMIRKKNLATPVQVSASATAKSVRASDGPANS